LHSHTQTHILKIHICIKILSIHCMHLKYRFGFCVCVSVLVSECLCVCVLYLVALNGGVEVWQAQVEHHDDDPASTAESESETPHTQINNTRYTHTAYAPNDWNELQKSFISISAFKYDTRECFFYHSLSMF